MAATRLIALHKNKGKSVAACLKSRTDYVQNPDKTEQGELISSYECSPLTVDEEFMLSKRQYELATGRRQKSDIIAYQIRQSFKPGEITAEEANKVGYELAMRFTKGKHAFVVATHTDRQHIHNHVIFNSTALDGTRKFRDFFFSALAVQRLSDLICLEHQLSVIEIKPYRERQKRTLYPPKESNRDKNLFEVILINDKRRIVISSFEKWYANQVKYHKVNGSPPGEELCKRSYSVPDVAEILKVKPETIYTLIRQGKLKTETTDFCMRIPKEEFERWYRSQSRYRTAADRERDREIEAQTISIPEMAKVLGIPRKNVYGILDCKKYRDCFVIERVADRPRITKKSFKAWLKSQSTYQLQKSKKETHEEPPLKLQCPKNGKYYSFQEIQAFYGISRPTLDSWVLKEGIPTMKLGRVKRIQKDAFDEVLKSKRKVEEDV